MPDTEDSASDSEGSLKEFIVNDEEVSESASEVSESSVEDDTEATSDDESDDSSEATDDSADAEEAGEDNEAKSKARETGKEASEEPKTKRAKVVKESIDDLKALEAEAKAFAGELSGTQIGQRTLRSRDPKDMEKRATKLDPYMERFGLEEERKLMEKFKKKDIIDFLKVLEPEWRSKYEAAGHTWPQPNMRQSLEAIEEPYYAFKQFAELPDSDDESDAEIDSDDEDISDDDEEEDD